jgi:hypothetical protein
MVSLVSRVSFIVLLLSAAFSPLLAHAGTYRLARSAASPGQLLFEQAFQRLGHARRFQFQEDQRILHQLQRTPPGSTRYSIAFLAPNRMATTLHSSRASHGVAQLETIQVGQTKCQRPPGWVCFPSPSPNPASLIRTLISPRMGEVSFRTARVPGGPGGAKSTEIRMSWQGSGLVYDATLLLQPRSGLPLSFSSSVRAHGELDIQQSASFDYAQPLSIRLPRSKRVVR